MFSLALGLVAGVYYGIKIADGLTDRTVIIKETTTVAATKIPQPTRQQQRPGQRQENRQEQRQGERLAQRQESVQVKPEGSAKTKRRNAQRKRSKAKKAQERLFITQVTSTITVIPGVCSMEVKQTPV